MRPVLVAAWYGHTGAVQMLIENGANCKAANKVRDSSDFSINIITCSQLSSKDTQCYIVQQKMNKVT